MGRQELEQMIVDYLKPFNLQRVGIFGSYARNEQKTDSDIDLSHVYHAISHKTLSVSK